ncbi:MAG TPA: porin [Caulobacteraceae bacterium]|nr:porin [Caulobacteraceae bacterium]
MKRSGIAARLARASAMGLWLASASTLALAAPHRKSDPHEARIRQLEQEMQQLADDNRKLHAQDEQLTARAEQLETEVAALKQSEASQTQVIQTQGQTLQAQAQSIKTVEANAPAAPSVVTNMLNGRPFFTSADGRFTFTAHTVMQLDTAAYFQAAPGPIAEDLRRSGPALGASAANVDLTHARDLKAGTDFRRARLGLDGTVFGDWDWRLLFDFAGTGVENTGQLYETWVQYSGFKPLRLRVGAFPPSIGMEDQASTNGMPFMERSVVEDLSRGFAAGDTRLAAQAYGWGDHWLLSAAITGRTIGVINTGTAAAVPQTFGDQLGFVGRGAITPFHGDDWLVQFGAHGSLARPGDNAGPGANGSTPITGRVVSFSNTQQVRVDGTKLLNTGNIDASQAHTVGGEFAAQKKNFLAQAEYESFGVDRTDIVSSPEFHGFYAEGLWTITGEPRVYNKQTAAFDAPIPTHPFDWNAGTWGAWELGVRYSDMDLNYHAGLAGAAPPPDGIRGGEEQNVSVDLNWYPNPVVKFMFDYEHVRVSRLSPNAVVYQTPVGAEIGQTYDAVAVRSQFSF